jgi:DNA-binding CsgD family transcriptional regulator
MTNNNSAKIIVICNSDIVLKGLGEILSLCNTDEVILLHQARELFDYPHLSGYILLIMPEDLFLENQQLINRLYTSSVEISHLNLNYDRLASPAKTGINIDDNQKLITGKVNERLKAFGKRNDQRTLNELTRRETDVLELVAKGLANKEVADKLGISIHTVISHRKNISEKTGIKSASGLTMYAVLKKIIDIDEITTSDLI